MKQTLANQGVRDAGQPWSREGVNAPITRAATLVIAAADAAPASKHQADYICTGIHDQEEIAIAIGALPSVGGTIRLTEGTFQFSATLDIATVYCPVGGPGAGGIAIKGAGYGTQIDYNNTDPVIDIEGTIGVVIEYLRIDAGGIHPGTSTDYVLRYWKDDVWVEECHRSTSLQVITDNVNFSAPSRNLITLPAFSVVTGVEVMVLEVFNSDGTDEVSVGLDPLGAAPLDPDALALPVDVSTLGTKIVLAGAYLGTLVETWGVVVVATYAAGGSAPTTGLALVTIYYYTR
jgi:hypothetical protein